MLAASSSSATAGKQGARPSPAVELPGHRDRAGQLDHERVEDTPYGCVVAHAPATA
jgi:hypothetical protein